MDLMISKDNVSFFRLVLLVNTEPFDMTILHIGPMSGITVCNNFCVVPSHEQKEKKRKRKKKEKRKKTFW